LDGHGLLNRQPRPGSSEVQAERGDGESSRTVVRPKEFSIHNQRRRGAQTWRVEKECTAIGQDGHAELYPSRRLGGGLPSAAREIQHGRNQLADLEAA